MQRRVKVVWRWLAGTHKVPGWVMAVTCLVVLLTLRALQLTSERVRVYEDGLQLTINDWGQAFSQAAPMSGPVPIYDIRTGTQVREIPRDRSNPSGKEDGMALRPPQESEWKIKHRSPPQRSRRRRVVSAPQR